MVMKTDFSYSSVWCFMISSFIVNITLTGSSLSSSVEAFEGTKDTSLPEGFKIITIDGDVLFLGAINCVYVLNLPGLHLVQVIEWSPRENDIIICKAKQKTEVECQNFIRVILKVSDNQVFICGTNAFNPQCRIYTKQNGIYVSDSRDLQSGVGIAPYDPNYNNTAVFAGGRIVSGTVTDFAAKDALIYGKAIDPSSSATELRTEKFSSEVLNVPNFVNSFDFEDKIYFFFRETAVETINCGKTVYSRVGRVCKHDQGGKFVLRKSWTSFFKARLNCSIPGEFPFYFNEIQSTSDIGQGNYTPSLGNTRMIYAVFNTPENSIKGSAICAYNFADIQRSFEGAFKAQTFPHSNWLPVPEDEVPKPHPAVSCTSAPYGNQSDHTLNFVKSHSNMDSAVPAFGGKPMFIHNGYQYQLTAIAIDWQVYSFIDDRKHDVIFVGTTDGRVVKLINKFNGTSVTNAIILDEMQVFENKDPVLTIHVQQIAGTLLVISKNEAKSIPLQRCYLQRTKRQCENLQDPHCYWRGSCKYFGDKSGSTDRHKSDEDETNNSSDVKLNFKGLIVKLIFSTVILRYYYSFNY